ncbi:MAG: hypothetical protein ACTSUE_13085 [Promethearchaeota archaeon]
MEEEEERRRENESSMLFNHNPDGPVLIVLSFLSLSRRFQSRILSKTTNTANRMITDNYSKMIMFIPYSDINTIALDQKLWLDLFLNNINDINILTRLFMGVLTHKRWLKVMNSEITIDGRQRIVWRFFTEKLLYPDESNSIRFDPYGFMESEYERLGWDDGTFKSTRILSYTVENTIHAIVLRMIMVLYLRDDTIEIGNEVSIYSLYEQKKRGMKNEDPELVCLKRIFLYFSREFGPKITDYATRFQHSVDILKTRSDICAFKSWMFNSSPCPRYIGEFLCGADLGETIKLGKGVLTQMFDTWLSHRKKEGKRGENIVK